MREKTLLIPLMVLMLTVFACGGSTAVPPAATGQPVTKTAKPTKPVVKPTPTEEEAMEPTDEVSQPATLPSELDDTFSGLEVIYYDGFDPVVAKPKGWVSSQTNTLGILPSGQMNVQMKTGYGGLFWFAQETISPMQGVFLTFKYTGEAETLTLGIDTADADGNVLPQTDEQWHSFAMEQQAGTQLNIHCMTSQGQDNLSIDGDLDLVEDTWYYIAMGYDDQNQYIMQIWDPDDPASQLFVQQTCETETTTRSFISWITPKRNLQIDDFTIFQFEEIVAAPTDGE